MRGVLTSDSATDALRVLHDRQCRRRVPRHLDARADRAGARPGAGPLQDAARRSSSSPRTSSTPSRPSTSTPSTTSSSRCARTGWPRRSAGCVEGGGPGRVSEDDQVAVELGGVTRFVRRSDIALRRGAGRLRPTAHRRRQPPGAHPAGDAGGGVGGRPASSGSTARCSSPSPHVEEVRTEAGRCTVLVGGHRARRQPAAHPRAARPARPPQPTGRRRDDDSPSGSGVTSPRTTSGRRRRRRPTRRRTRSTRRARSARSTCARCCAPSSGSGSRLIVLLAVLVGGLPLLFWLLAGLDDRSQVARHAAGVGAAGLRGLPDRWSRSAGGTSARRAQRARLHRRGPAPVTAALAGGPIAMNHAFGIVAVLVVSVLTVGIGIWGLRFSRTTSDFFVASRTVRPALNASRDRRRVPLRRVVPRRRRAGARVRRRHALVPGRLDRRLPRAARPGRGPAAPLGRLHAARLRPGPAAVAAGPRSSPRPWSWPSAGST